MKKFGLFGGGGRRQGQSADPADPGPDDTLDPGDDEGGQEAGDEGGDDPRFEALMAELEDMKRRNAVLEGRIDEQSRQPAPGEAAPKEFTRAELQAQVDAGSITEDQRDQVLDEQRERKLEAKLREELRQELTQQQGQASLREQFDAYREKIPGLETPGHENRTIVEQEYQQLIAAGLPDGAATELAALRAAFGPPEKIREKTRGARERSGEAAGTGGGGDPAGGGGEGWKRGLDAKRVAYLERQLQEGYYTGTDDPNFVSYVKTARGGDPKKIVRERRAAAEKASQQALH